MKNGFTLAETLITLAIIGIVAAMTIPTMIQKNFEKRTVTQLRATQSILSQALRMAEEEHGTMDGWVSTPQIDTVTANAYAEKLKPFLKLALDCGVKDPNSKCIYKGQYKLKNGLPANSPPATAGYYYIMKLYNGSSIFFRYAGKEAIKLHNANGIVLFIVDTNGANSPNQWGKDTFQFAYYSGLGLIPFGAPGSNFPYTSYCLEKTSAGYGCAYYVLNYQNMNYLHTKK